MGKKAERWKQHIVVKFLPDCKKLLPLVLTTRVGEVVGELCQFMRVSNEDSGSKNHFRFIRFTLDSYPMIPPLQQLIVYFHTFSSLVPWKLERHPR